MNERYQIVEVLSDEFNSTEYLVKDLHNWGMLKVMKVFDADVLSISFLKYFESSFVDIKNHKHPNIVNLYEFAPIKSAQGVKLGLNQFFYTYEHVDKRQISYLELEKSQINDVIMQLCKIVRYLHFRGVVYRFLNFDNIRIYMHTDNTVHVKLVNLADISVFEHLHPESYEFTSDFIAPEMNWGENIGYSVDIYSLGIILYYLYYKKDYNVEGMANIHSTNQLNSFILRCISQIPEDRFQTIDEFISEVERLIWINVTKDDYRFYDRMHDSTQLIGREYIIDEVMGIIESKNQRNTNINSIYIVGDYGEGKTRVLREIARLCGFRKHSFVSVEIGADSGAYSCISQIVRYVLSSDSGIVNLVSKYWKELKVLVPEFFQNYQWGDSNLDIHRDHLRILNRAVKFVQEYCYSNCLVVLLDGVEYLHGYDRVFFTQLLNSQQSLSFLAIFGVSEFSVFSESNYLELKLGNLTKTQIHRMIEQILGMSDLPEEFVDLVMYETNGKASLIRRLMLAYYSSKVVYFDRDRYRWSFSNIESDYGVGYYSEFMKFRMDLLDGISQTDLEILKKMAIIVSPVEKRVLLDAYDIDDSQLSELLGKKLVNINGDGRYSIYDRDIKNLLYKRLTDDEVREYSAAMVDAFLKNDCIDSSIVQYMRDAELYQKVAEFATLMAGESFKAKDIQGFISMTRIAEEMYVQLGDLHSADRTAVFLGDKLYNAGLLQDALSLLEHRDFADMEHRFNSNMLLGRTLLMMGRNDESYDYIFAAFNLANELENDEYILKTYYIFFDYYYDILNIDKAREVLGKALQLSKRADLHAYHYMFTVKSGDQTLLSESEMREMYHAACDYFEQKDEVVFLCGMHDLEAQRRYYAEGDLAGVIRMFDRSEDIAISKNYTFHTMLYHHLFAHICWHHSMYGQAAVRLEKAMAYAKNSGALNISATALAKYISTKIELCEYRQAYIQISKLEYETKFVSGHKNATLDLYFYKLKYLLLMNNIIEARRLRYELSSDEVTDKHNAFRLRVLDIKLTYLSELQRGKLELKEDTIVAIHELLYLVDSSVNAKLFRELVLDITLNLILDSDITNVSYLLKLDEQVAPKYTSERIEITKSVINTYLNQNAASELASLVETVGKESLELLWRLHYLRGNIFFSNRCYVEALRAYMNAFEVVKDLSDRVPVSNQKHYIMNDPFKMILKVRINDIIKHICDTERIRHVVEPKKIIDAQDYFDLSNFASMMEDNEIALKISGSSAVLQDVGFMSKYSINDNANIKQILSHMADMVFARRGFIFVLGESENYGDVIALKAGDEQGDFLRYIYGSGSEQCIVVNKFNAKTQTHLLRSGQCGLIHIPIFELAGDRRRIKQEDMLRRRKKIVAHLFLETDDVINRFEPKFLDYLESYSTLIAVFLESAKLKLSSTMDKLTQVNLRKYFEQIFTITLAESRNTDEDLSVIILDIDNFKGVNDTYGHKKGDTVLAAVGQILLSSVRSTDIVARYGGEEFIVLLPNTNGEQAYIVSEKIRRNVEAARLLGDDRPLTVSLGVSSFPGDGTNEAELIENADKALYFSKGQGKNQTTRWTRSIMNQAKRFDTMTGIISGRVEEDIRRVQAMLKSILAMGSNGDKNKVREEVFRTVLDIVNGTYAEFYVLDDSKNVLEAVGFEMGVGLQKLNEYDYRNISKYAMSNTSDYFIDWERPIGGSEDTADWESIIVNSFYSEGINGVLLFKVPISVYEHGFADFNYVASIRKVIERAIF